MLVVDKIMDDEMDRVFSMYGREMNIDFWSEALRE
jgi:hypothetical protein